MDCKEFDSIIEAFALGDLDEARAQQCEEHLQACDSCRETLDVYRLLVGSVGSEPELAPTQAETAALTLALKSVELYPRPVKPDAPVVPGLAGFILASVIAFMAVVAVLALQISGVIDLGTVLGEVGYMRLAGVMVAVVFVTTFVPIAMTAWRRPLNGMTFRR